MPEGLPTPSLSLAPAHHLQHRPFCHLRTPPPHPIPPPVPPASAPPPAGLCNEVPPCLRDRIDTFQGTSLLDTLRSSDSPGGGYCGVPPPTCLAEAGCQVLAPAPPYWTSASSLAIAFGGFASPANWTGVLQYRWAVGSTQWARDVVDWVDVLGASNITQTVQVGMLLLWRRRRRRMWWCWGWGAGVVGLPLLLPSLLLLLAGALLLCGRCCLG